MSRINTGSESTSIVSYGVVLFRPWHNLSLAEVSHASETRPLSGTLTGSIRDADGEIPMNSEGCSIEP